MTSHLFSTTRTESRCPRQKPLCPTYSPEEEKRIIRNADGVPVGIRPDNRWTPVRIATWVAITALGVLGWWMLAVVRGEHVNTIWFVVTAVCTYAIGYRFYALYIQRRIMRPDDTNATPAERINNGRDFDPTHRVVLYGHHFAAIAGAGPLVGPVLAAQMGYLPGTLWIIIGVLVAGAVQDMLVLFSPCAAAAAPWARWPLTRSARSAASWRPSSSSSCS